MKSFIQHILEARKKKLRVFDFDDTLAKTTGKVLIRDKKTNDIVHELDTQQYANHVLHPSHYEDFSQFKTIEDAEPLQPADKIARQSSRAGRKTMILTARSQRSAPSIGRYLRTRGIRGAKVVGVGDYRMDAPQAKAIALKQELRRMRGVTHVEFMDDSPANIHAVRKIQPDFPNIKFKFRRA